MRTTASYELFPDAPSERAIARARYLAREGRVADAEKAYRDVLAEHPDLKLGWAECFELLRGQGRSEEHTSELQSLTNLVCRLLLEKKKIERGDRMPTLEVYRRICELYGWPQTFVGGP